jgi:hypothetical protein
MTTTIYKLAQHGDRMVDASHNQGGYTRVALQWEHLNDDGTINDAGTALIEEKVKEDTGADEIEWSK